MVNMTSRFQPEEGDILTGTRKWSELQPPLTFNYMEKTYNRGDKKVISTCKTATGPAGPVERLKWKKFGSVKKNTTTVGPDVYIEYTTQKRSTDLDDWTPNGLYTKYAREDGWTDEEIKKIVKSDKPDQVYYKLLKVKIERLIAEAKVKWAKMNPSEQVTGTGEETFASNVKMGLRERMLLKQRNTSSETGKGSSSLSAKMQERKNERDESKCTLFVQNVPEGYDESDIKSHIEQFEYRRVNIVRREGVSAGKAFIELESATAAQACLNHISGAHWGHCVIEVQLSKPKTKNNYPSRTGGGWGRGRGSGIRR